MTDPRPTLAAPDDDPYLWLEEVEGEQATAWADARTAGTVARLADARYGRDRDALRALLDRPDNLPVPARRAGLLYNLWRDAAQPRGLWRRTTLPSYRTPAPDWEVLLDLDALAVLEGEDWVWQGAATLPPDHARALIRLSRGGSDAAVLREFDLPSRRFVPNGFVLPEAKGGAAWLDADTLLLSSALGGETRSGYASTVRLWRRGEDWSAAASLFTTDPGNMNAWGSYDRLGNRLIFGKSPASSTRMSGSATARGRNSGSSCRATPAIFGKRTGWRWRGGPNGGRGRTRSVPTRLPSSACPRSLRATGGSRPCSGRRRAGRCKASSGPRAASC